MDREGLLKELVKEKYGSILKFSKETGIPESSIRNIFSRGMDSVNAGTLVDICKKLNVDLESLMDGALSVRPNLQKDMVWKDHVKKAPAQEGERSVRDADIKFALFGGDGDITDEMYEEVKRFAKLVKLREEAEKKGTL